MSPRRKRRPSWLQVAVQRVGVRRGADVMSFVLSWAGSEGLLGRGPTVEEYAVHWRVSSRTVYRELAAFRECWPEFDTPSELLDAMRASGRQYFAPTAPVPEGLLNGA